MRSGVEALSDREKETLRLLLAGYDAKSIASELRLSVHTVNERLRDARRKLGVSSSREAARTLAQAEREDPKSVGDNRIGVAERPRLRPKMGQSHGLAWLGGGMLVMSLIVAALVFSGALQGSSTFQGSPATPAVAQRTAASDATSAEEWAALLDERRWNDSWSAAGTLFKSRMPEPQWASTIEGVRAPLGAVSSRALKGITKATNLPGAPDGDYEIVQFNTSFANKKDAVETVVLGREGPAWKVDGYFIR